MAYSQKYCLVSFNQPLQAGTDFTMRQWPLHITLADVFAIELTPEFNSQLNQLISSAAGFEVKAGKEATLGETKVVLIEKTKQLNDLHLQIVTLLNKHGATFNNPEFTKDGFLPHCTIQQDARMIEGETTHVNSVSLIDMFPDQDWHQRKVLQTFELL